MLPISNIKWRDYKTWTSTPPSSLYNFCSLNFFYGTNGTGKSSLSKLVAETYYDISGRIVDGVKIFDSNFINNALKLSNSDKICGVVSNFGEGNVVADNTLSEKIAELEDVTIKIKSTEEQIDNIEEKIANEISKAYICKKGTANIKQKPQNKTSIEQLDLWHEDYETAKKKFPKVNLEQYSGSGASNDELEELDLLGVPNLPIIDEQGLCSTLIQPYDNSLVPKKSIVDWIEEGVKYHKEHGEKQCIFCSNKLDLSLVEKRLEEYQNNEKNEKAIFLTVQNKHISQYISAIEDITKNISRYRRVGEINEKTLMDSTTILQETRKSIVKKLNKMECSISLDKELIKKAVDNTNDILEKLQNKKSQRVKELGREIASAEILTKGAIGFVLSNNPLVVSVKKEYTNAKNLLNRLQQEREKINHEITKLKRSKSKLANFSTYINKILLNLNMRFYLEPDDEEKNFYIKHKDAKEDLISVDDISEGERNILALIYFLYSLLDEKENIKDEIELIIIDDPISSLDENNKFILLQFLTELAEKVKQSKEKNKQLFLFTHSINDFINLTYNYKNDQKNAKLFRIFKSNNKSKLKTIPKRILSPYQLIYEDIYLFSRLTDDDLSNEPDETAIHIPNSMRRLLEDYCDFRIGVKDVNIAHKGDVSKALFGREISELKDDEKRKLENILRICNVLSHKASSYPYEINEVQRAAKDLMSILYQNDKYHHLKMIESLSLNP